MQLEHGVEASASHRDFLLRQKSQLLFARVLFNGVGGVVKFVFNNVFGGGGGGDVKCCC